MICSDIASTRRGATSAHMENLMVELKLFLSAIDRLIEFFKIKEKRFAIRYNEIYKPAFADLQQVHGDYISMFDSVGRTLADIPQNGHLNVEESLKAAAKFLADRRIALDPVRAKLAEFRWTLAEASVGNLNSSEKEFLSSLVAYFDAEEYRPEAVSASRYLIDRIEDAIHRVQMYSDAASRSGAGWNNTGAERFFDKISEACQAMIAKLNARWLDVVGHYNKLRFELARETS
jgi:hypothetical protein